MDRMKSSLPGKRALFVLAVLLIINILVLSGCSGTSGDNKEGGETVSAGESVTSPETGASPRASDGESLAAEPENTAGSVMDTAAPAEEKTNRTVESEPAGDAAVQPNEEEKEDTLSEPEDADQSSAPDDADEIDEDISSVWENSFLLFLPKFNAGIPEDRVSEETFDHIMIGGISSKRAIEDYVEEVKAAGFNIDADYVDHNGDIDFHAHNSDGWYVTVNYDINTAKADIGCGFFNEEKEKSVEDYFGEEILAVLPLPENGVLSGGRADGDYPYVLYDGIELEDARAYAKKLKKAGFDKDVLEGEANDLCWYNAAGPGRFICDMQYADGILMIGCDREEDE